MGLAANASKLKKTKQSRRRNTRIKPISQAAPRMASLTWARVGRGRLPGGWMNNKAIDPTKLADLAATVGFSVKEANKTKVSALLASIRNGVMRRADVLPEVSDLNNVCIKAPKDIRIQDGEGRGQHGSRSRPRVSGSTCASSARTFRRRDGKRNALTCRSWRSCRDGGGFSPQVLAVPATDVASP